MGLFRGVSERAALASSEEAAGEACSDAGRSDRGVAGRSDRGVAFTVPPATCIHAVIEVREERRVWID